MINAEITKQIKQKQPHDSEIKTIVEVVTSTVILRDHLLIIIMT